MISNEKNDMKVVIEAFTANTIEIQGKELPIGRNYKNAVLNALHYSIPVAGV